MGLKKYFIAIIIPEPLFTMVEKIKLDFFLENNLKGALRSPSHITLHRPFVWKEEKEEELIKRLKQFNQHATFQITLNNFNFFEPRVIFIDVMQNFELIELHKKLKNFAKKELNLFNEVNDKRSFKPHITIACRDLKKTKFNILKEKMKTKNFEGYFNYDGLTLLKLEKSWHTVKKFDICNNSK